VSAATTVSPRQSGRSKFSNDGGMWLRAGLDLLSMALAQEIVVALTATGTLAVTLISMSVKQHWDRATERRAIAQRELETLRAHDRTQVAQVQQRLLDQDTQAKVELLVIAGQILRGTEVERALGSICESSVCRFDESESDEVAVRRQLLLVSNPLERSYLAVLFDIAINWREFDTFHGRDSYFQHTVGRIAVKAALEALGALLRQEPVPYPCRTLARRLPENGDKALRAYSFPLEVTSWDPIVVRDIPIPERFAESSLFVGGSTAISRRTWIPCADAAVRILLDGPGLIEVTSPRGVFKLEKNQIRSLAIEATRTESPAS
jgi:hypothetical protein